MEDEEDEVVPAADPPLGLVITNLYQLFNSDCVTGNKMQKQRSEEEEQDQPYLFFVNNQDVSVSLAETLKFEVAYSHNRNNDYHNTLDDLDTVAQPGLNNNELRRAQVLYKLEQFEVHLFAET